MKKIIASFIAFAAITACNPISETSEQTEPPTAEISQYKFVHTVFFWLKEGTSAEEKAAFEEGMKKLGTVNTIGNYFMGIPSTSDRDVVDDSFDYAWIVHFPDAAAEESYQLDPKHLQFIENHQHIWDRVVVYDTEVKDAK